MKLFKVFAIVAILAEIIATNALADNIGLTINSYVAMQPGNVAATNYTPVFSLEPIGMFIGYDIGLGDAGKIMAGLEDYAKISFPSTETKWVDILEVSATYAISAFSVKVSLPSCWGNLLASTQLIQSFYIMPCYKIQLDKQMWIVMDMWAWFYVFGKYVQLADTIQLDPRVRFIVADFYAMVRADLNLQSLSNLNFYAYVGYTIAGVTPELSLKLSNINSSSTTAPALGITPYFKLIYKIVL